MKWEKYNKTEKKEESLFDRQMRVSWDFQRNFIIESMNKEQLEILEKAMKEIKALKK